MDGLSTITIFLIVAAVFGALLWLSIFLTTYIHFPRMEPKKRIRLSLLNATAILGILLICSLAFFLILKLLLNIDV